MGLLSDRLVDPAVKECLVIGQRVISITGEHSAVANNCISKMDDCIAAARACFESESDEEAEERFLELRAASEAALATYESACEKADEALKEVLAIMKEVRELRLSWRNRRECRRQLVLVSQHLTGRERLLERVRDKMGEFARWSVETDIRHNRPIR
ncbi:hypothetical protein F4X86_03890 [Candidatus Saccharibacteria bacterium]|nr:hypothetical protein [Candidatus Saccharibacteria bacterium]